MLEDKFVYGIFGKPREYSERGNFSSAHLEYVCIIVNF